jgi:hypothetical protein
MKNSRKGRLEPRCADTDELFLLEARRLRPAQRKCSVVTFNEIKPLDRDYGFVFLFARLMRCVSP